jgi:hypothetical protein
VATDLPSQEAVERAQLQRFASASKLIDLSAMRRGVPPEPDFVTTDLRLGIDFTELHVLPQPGERPRQAQDNYQLMTVNRAHREYVARRLPAVRASVFFVDNVMLTKAHVEPLALVIVSLVASNVPPEPGMGSRVDRSTRGLPEALHSISITNTVGICDAHVAFNGGAWVPPLTRDDVQRPLDEKERKLASYRNRCASAWLVINANEFGASTWFRTDDIPEVLKQPFKSSFDRAFLSLGFGDAVHELALIR